MSLVLYNTIPMEYVLKFPPRQNFACVTEGALSGVWGRSPQQGPGKFLKNRGVLVPLKVILAIKKETAVKSYVF